MNNINLLYPRLFLLFLLIIMGCAQEGELTGGEKDTLPPLIRRSKPEDFATGFKEKKLVLTFNEYIQLTNIEQEFVASPPLKQKPDFKISGKSLIVKLKQSLDSNVTYTFKFGNAIKDINEGNVLKKHKMIVSTYDIIDTLQIYGNLISAFDKKPQANKTVMVYSNNYDSIPYLEKPSYIAVTDSLGKFELDFLKTGSYKIFALDDMNSNLIYDLPNEKIAFLDSLITPRVEVVERIDTLKKGTILHKAFNVFNDTLKTDSVIIQKFNQYTPSNLVLKMFEEDKAQQFIKTKSRPMKGKCIIGFNRPIYDTVLVFPIDFQLNPDEIFIEEDQSRDTLIYWIKDSLIINRDSLRFQIIYNILDSANNYTNKTDTVIFVYQKPTISKSKKIIRDNFVTSNILKNIEITNEYFLYTNTPILKFDTSKVTLYEQIDSAVIDEKKQKMLKCIRIAPDKIFLTFSRPVIHDPFFFPTNFSMEENFDYKFNPTRDTLLCTITEKNLGQTDTLKTIVKYDNLFYFDEIQEFKDTVALSLTKQSVKRVSRTNDEIIKINFSKDFSNYRINSINELPQLNNFEINKEWENITINLLDSRLIQSDTLEISVKILDYIDLNGKEIYYSDFIKTTYNRKIQLISSSVREPKDKISLSFAKPLIDLPKVSFLDFDQTEDFDLNINQTKDSVEITLKNPKQFQKDTLSIIINYKDKIKNGQIIEKTDILKLKTTATKKTKPETKQQKVTMNMPIKITIDSLPNRTYLLSKNWESDKKYKIKIDSAAFTDIFNQINDSLSIVFKSQPEDYYGKLKLNISNLGLVENDVFNIQTDTSFYENDSIIYSSRINTGQAILQIFNDKNIIYYETQITSDTTINFEKIAPEKFSVKLIYDANNNNKWDTGDYLMKIQPEKVFIFEETLQVKSKWETQYEWNLIKQFKAIINN